MFGAQDWLNALDEGGYEDFVLKRGKRKGKEAPSPSYSPRSPRSPPRSPIVLSASSKPLLLRSIRTPEDPDDKRRKPPFKKKDEQVFVRYVSQKELDPDWSESDTSIDDDSLEEEDEGEAVHVLDDDLFVHPDDIVSEGDEEDELFVHPDDVIDEAERPVKRSKQEDLWGSEESSSDHFFPHYSSSDVRETRERNTGEAKCFACNWIANSAVNSEKINNINRMVKENYGRMTTRALATQIHLYHENEIRRPAAERQLHVPRWSIRCIMHHIKKHVLDPSFYIIDMVKFYREQIRILKPKMYKEVEVGTRIEKVLDDKICKEIREMDKRCTELLKMPLKSLNFYSERWDIDFSQKGKFFNVSNFIHLEERDAPSI